VGTDHRELLKSGQAQYAPISVAQLPGLIHKGTLSLDAAMIQVSPPDAHGYVSLGVSVDTTLAAVEHAASVIAEVNSNMPFTYGESCIPLQSIDTLVLADSPVIEYVHKLEDHISDSIARYVSSIIDDHSTLQIGLGQVPNEMLKHLKNRRNLGIHSDVITDSLLDLIEEGVITGNAKALHRGKIVTSYCMGTEKLYRKVDRNPLFAFHPIDYVCDPSVIMANHKQVSVTQAWSVDLTGQVCADQFRGEFYSGVSSQLEFHRYASRSPGGKSIVCLCSTAGDQKESRIRPMLLEGEGVVIPRSEVHFVVTEYGYAHLFGKTLQNRALSLIEIAHPDHRAWLLGEAKRMGYVPKDMTLKTRGAYPVYEEHRSALKGGMEVTIRPSRASDISGIKDLFYNLSPEDVFTRFFYKLSSLPVSIAQQMCNVDYEQDMAFVAVIGGREHGIVIGTSGYSVDPEDNMGEVAYMIRPDFQGKGLGSKLQKCTVDYARKCGLRGLKADILTSNRSMLNLIQKLPNVQITREFDRMEVRVLF
jgi:acyl-CoA hydrolase/GNAT superfamily N-acetyltransferase